MKFSLVFFSLLTVALSQPSHASTPRPLDCGSLDGWNYSTTHEAEAVYVRITQQPSENTSILKEIVLKNIDETRPYASPVKSEVFEGNVFSYDLDNRVLSVGSRKLECK